MIFNSKHKKKGMALAEVLIVLGIISTAMVTSVGVLARSLSEINQNELQDSANLSMVQAMEIIKSPSDVYVSDIAINTIAVNTTRYFSYKTQNNLNFLNLETSSTAPITTCTAGNIFNMTNYNSDFQNLFLCMQIAITPRTVNNNRVYEIKSRVVYQLPNATQSNEILGYKYSDFKIQPGSGGRQ